MHPGREVLARQTLLLAQAALNRGQAGGARDLAIRVIDLEPTLSAASQLDGQRRHRLVAAAIAICVDAEIALGQTDSALDRSNQAWLQDPVDPHLAAAKIRALDAAVGPNGALDAFGLSLVNPALSQPRSNKLSPAGGPVCMMICRDEMHQLPSFLSHHRALGVTRFIVIDNGSRDDSVAFLVQQADVELWSTATNFRELAFGASAFTAIARAQLADRWCLILDADERFVVPAAEQQLDALIRHLDRHQLQAVGAVLVDLYDQLPLVSARPSVPANLIGNAYLDRRWMHETLHSAGPFGNGVHLVGGLRRRLFDGTYFLLSKVPLVKFTNGRLLVAGQHDTNAPVRFISSARACLLHTKFLSPIQQFDLQVGRAEHANDAADYKQYAWLAKTHPDRVLFDPECSTRYDGPSQLVEMGVMQHADMGTLDE